ncbi:DUF3325 family protein [Rubrivivax sp. RP6-9]|uniref:DUF3325 family protein n=1 Tax=Rubrivivax sp. RP6-9 TaxID=3415750 RepID=UPI003CC5637E
MAEPGATAAWALPAALACAVVGCAWLALALPAHWQQVQSAAAPTRLQQLLLRTAGAAALAAAGGLCLRADHPGMAALVWVMLLAAAASTVAFTLAWRARWLAPLVCWLPAGAAAPPLSREVDR